MLVARKLEPNKTQSGTQPPIKGLMFLHYGFSGELSTLAANGKWKSMWEGYETKKKEVNSFRLMPIYIFDII